MESIARLHAIAFELETETTSTSPQLITRASHDFQSENNSSVEEGLVDMKISYPTEPSLSKERCNLCKLYFSRDTVNYKVPIHRIIDLKKSWDEKNASGKFQGRRYNFPSYLYTTTSVCLFCSQFFSTLPSERHPSPSKSDLNVLDKKELGPKLEITTQLGRTNIAEGTKAYQSTEVDYKYAIYAVTPPYELFTRTKREVDPWWEVDLGRKYSLESINFFILIGIRQTIEVHIFLLGKPIGFENPFLDAIIQQSTSSTHYQTTIKGKEKPFWKEIHWKLPPNAVSYAVRIQLKGIQTLSIQKFQAFQGSDLYLPTETDIVTAQESYAALRPEIIQATIKEKELLQMKAMVESGELAELVNHSEFSLSHNHSFDKIDAVAKLQNVVKDRYLMLAEWKERVLKAASVFTEDEITSLYKVIFRYTSDLYTQNKEMNTLTERDLLTTGITLFYPRCDLYELHSRIRSILYWIQTRSHLKTLGPLINCTALVTIANNSHEPLFRLMTVFKRIDYFWQKKEEKHATIEKQHQQLNTEYHNSSVLHALLYNHNPSLSTPNVDGLVVPKISDYRGCSWSQFLIILNAFVMNNFDNIPYQAFHIDHPKPNAPIDDQGSQYTFRSGDAMSNSSYSVSVAGEHYSHHRNQPRQIGSSQRKSSSRLESRGESRPPSSDPFPFSSSLFSGSINRLEQPSWGTNSLFSPTQSMVIFQQSITNTSSLSEDSLFDTARKAGKIIHQYDSSFAEYRFAHFKKQQQKYLEFPPELSLEFAKSLNPRRPMTSTFGSNRNQDSMDEAEKGKTVEVEGVQDAEISGDISRTVSADESLGNPRLAKSLPILPSGNSSVTALTTSNQKGKTKPPTKPQLQKIATVGSKDFFAIAGIDDDVVALNQNARSPPPKRPSALTSMGSVQLTPLLSSFNEGSAVTEGKTVSPLKRQQTSVNNTSLTSMKSSSTNSHGTPSGQKHKTSHKLPTDSSPTKVQFKSFTNDNLDDNLDSFDDFDDDSNGKKGANGGNEIKNIDFFRICGLCELRLPRDAIEMKVFRKHIVKLRSSWDPKLVSKEVRSLDNTISMYNLVYVCYFCAQYFDPDFPDGIACPTHIPAEKKKKKQLLSKNAEGKEKTKDFPSPSPVSLVTLQLPTGTDSSESLLDPALSAVSKIDLPDSLEIYALKKKEKQLVPFYDTRHLSSPKTVGEVFARPETKESRKKARRALEVVENFERRRHRINPQTMNFS